MYQKTLKWNDFLNLLKVSLTFSFASSIKWDYREVVHMATTNVVRSEFILGVCDVDTISTGNGTYVVHVCNIVDDNRVPDIRINSSNIQGPWSSPRDIN